LRRLWRRRARGLRLRRSPETARKHANAPYAQRRNDNAYAAQRQCHTREIHGAGGTLSSQLFDGDCPQSEHAADAATESDQHQQDQCRETQKVSHADLLSTETEPQIAM
jgi:hypothetical protein